MKQKTIRLKANEYRLKSGILEVLSYDSSKVGYYNDLWSGGKDTRCDACKKDSHSDRCECNAWTWKCSRMQEGVEVMLVSHTYVGPNRDRDARPVFSLISSRPDGIGGNSDPDITRYHGWRGTTDDVSCHAHGLRKIVEIRQLKNGQIAVTVGKDLKPDED